MLVWIPNFDLAKLLFQILNFVLEQITVPSAAAFDSTIHLLWDNVAVGNPAKSSLICFFLKQSKCDMFGAGVEVFGKPVCPVTTYFWHTSFAQRCSMSIFKDSQGKPVMKSVFIWEIWDAHTSMGLPANKIPSHRQACQPSYSKSLEIGLSGGWGSTTIAHKPHPLQEDRRFRARNSINTSLCRLHNLGMHSLVSWTRNPLLRKAKFGDRFQHQATFFVR